MVAQIFIQLANYGISRQHSRLDDEFALMVLGSQKSQILQLGEGFCAAIESLSLKIEAELISLTCSICIASMFRLKGAISHQNLLATADVALYQAKFGGRNQVILF
ncbi:MAG: diguanylate cyclase [Cyanobacteriota bacterium]